MRATTAVSQTESYIFIHYLTTRRDNNETLDRVVVVIVVFVVFVASSLFIITKSLKLYYLERFLRFKVQRFRVCRIVEFENKDNLIGGLRPVLNIVL